MTPRNAYRDSDGFVYRVCLNKPGGRYATFFEQRPGKLMHKRHPALPFQQTRDTAQADLDIWAVKHGLEVVVHIKPANYIPQPSKKCFICGTELDELEICEKCQKEEQKPKNNEQVIKCDTCRKAIPPLCNFIDHGDLQGIIYRKKQIKSSKTFYTACIVKDCERYEKGDLPPPKEYV